MAIKTMIMSDLSSINKDSLSRWRRYGWYVFWLLLALLGAFLGAWQWERADTKQVEAALREDAPTLVNPQTAPAEGAELTLNGEYMSEHTFF